MKENEYQLVDVMNLECIYIIRGKAIFVTLSGKLI